MKIFTKFFIFIILVMLLSFIIIGVFSVVYTGKMIGEKMIKTYANYGQIISKQIELGYTTYEWPFELLEKLSSSEGFQFWLIVKPDQTIYLSSNNSLSGIKTGYLFPSYEGSEIFDIPSRNLKIIVTPLNIREGEEWHFWLGFSTKDIKNEERKILLVYFLVFLLIGVFLSFLIYLLILKITKPIENLAKNTRKIAKGKLNEEINPEGDDEIKGLSKSFNEMRIGLKDRNDLLNSLLKTFKGKFGKVAIILVRHNIDELIKKNPRIKKILPDSLKKIGDENA